MRRGTEPGTNQYHPPTVGEAMGRISDDEQDRITRVDAGGALVVLHWGTATHAGNRRELNEDASCVASPVFAVADGMGGHSSGEVASSLAVGALSSLRSATAVSSLTLRECVEKTNELIFDHSGAGERVMGTTVTGFALSAAATPQVSVFNVGDSRTYRLEGGRLDQVTVDHSHVQELIDIGEITAEEALTHPERNVVTRALGVDRDVSLDVFDLPIVPGQRWLCCSDGLTGELAIDVIASTLGGGTPQEAADALVTLTLEGPARDNVTVVVVDVVGVEQSASASDPSDAGDETTLRNSHARVVDAANAPEVPPAGLIDDVPAVDPIETEMEIETEVAETPGPLIDGAPDFGSSGVTEGEEGAP